ncbi:MAG TPA: 3-oxoacyl-[acyl-carrier-protein] reductase [Kiritimatiellia bacterium]|nr:3-oxoacyl-[acyl-carrier-protein] reductase [Kiritimatiellia bacterium]HNS80943.1 3-oxoacyl-[acyl-carrier-protein] reductase [Kiritimatiellia bacterium]HPA78831.1 3-oxoacyl-[acyl-carrier-protein] reductase [Kiritimatiellia bacterium]HQQ03975.1 3-oxoacyl-[acyl-carrier-protein] reductase [Kiritimatiellia bacterium]
MDLNGKVAIVTGAARGIGQAVAVRLASAGADIALCDVQAGWLDETAGRIAELGRRAEKYAVDVSSSADVEAAISQIHQDFGHIDVLVNNAGITKDGLLARMSEQDWDAVLNVNLKGAFLFCKAASRIMMKQRTGSIVNMASIIGLIGNAGQCNYAASKGGLISLTKSVAKELAGRNVRANAVAPGFIETKMTEKLSPDVQQKMLEAIPMKRFGKPEDVANVVLFLASDASAYMTGQTLTVSGGMVM